MAYDYCIGIDFGTTKTLASYVDGGERKFLTALPSVIYVDEGGEVSVGLAAQNYGSIQPENMITSAKKFIGDVETKTWNCNGYDFSPLDVTAEILKVIRRRFIEQNNLEANVEIGAVVAVPVNFSDSQRGEIRKAAEIAGFEILDVLEDSTAAAIETFSSKPTDKKILVVDIGGGNYSLSVLEGENLAYRTIAIDGENNFGGDDFDRLIFAQLIYKVEDDLKLNLSDAYTAMLPEFEYNKLINRLTLEARRLKENLTTSERCEINLKELLKFDGKTYTLKFTITRADFDELAFPLYEKIFDRLKNFVTANFDAVEIGHVILAGGTCQIPYVRARVFEEFGIEPESAAEILRLVASGAARIAELKNSAETLESESVLAHSLGVAMMTDARQMIFDKILEKGTPYPCEVIREYETAFDNQTRIDINIYEAGNESESDLKFHRFRGTLTLKNIPPAPKGQSFIDVKFEYTEDKSLRVTAVDKQRANHFERQIIESPARLRENIYDARN